MSLSHLACNKTTEIVSASYSLTGHNIMICTTWIQWTNWINPFTEKALSRFIMTQLSTQSPITGTKTQHALFNCQGRNTSCRDVRETTPTPLHTPCSHRGNMPCLFKLTTSSTQQSQQTCMCTYLSKIEDSFYPWTMTKVSGSTPVKGLRQAVNCFDFTSCKSMKAIRVRTG